MSVCPNCRKPLVVLELEGVEIDHCMECGGTWLDAGELERICENAGAPSRGISTALGRAQGGKTSARRCPRCGSKLRAAAVGGAQGAIAEIDHCPRGHGMWLDRGEMRTLIESTVPQEAARALAGFLADLYRQELQPLKGD